MQDLFNGTNGTALATYDANYGDLDASYTVAEMEIQSAAAVATVAAATSGARYTGSTQVISEIIIGPCTATGNPSVGPVILSDGTNRGIQAEMKTISGGNWTLMKLNNNGTNITEAAISADASTTVKIKIVGTNVSSGVWDVEIFVNDVSVLTRTNISSQVSGNPGFFVISQSDDNTRPEIQSFNDGILGTITSLPILLNYFNHLLGGIREMKKNTAGQKWVVFAFQDEGGANPGEPVTGDALNITGTLYLDGVSNAIDDTNPTELGGGYYEFDITQAESNADLIAMVAASSTANVNIIGVPGAVWTSGVIDVDANGIVSADSKKINGTTVLGDGTSGNLWRG